MTDVLAKIVLDKKEELKQRKLQLPLESFKDYLIPSKRSFYEALDQPNAGFIFECKKASPSKGLIREPFNLDEIIAAYAPYAACISVLTDQKYFKGSFDYLEYVRKNVNQPVLNKDFFIDPYQIYLARHHHADAVLLMLSVLSDEQYTQLSAIADEYELDVLTEVSNEQETRRALNLGARIIGINNRDLRDLSTDLATSERLVPIIRDSGFDGLVISESGIYEHRDIQRLSPIVDGFLVGSSVMAQKNLALAVKKLIYGETKICGITRVEDALNVKQSGAVYAGLIFAEKSPRRVSPEQALEIVESAPFQYVGVFVNHTIEVIVEIAQKLKLTAVQLHGDEDQSFIDMLRIQLAYPCEIWKAVGVSDNTLPFFDYQQVDKILFDRKVAEKSGGTGQVFDWQILTHVPSNIQFVLAGGLSIDNIKQAQAILAAGLDINSGVESSPGIKDTKKIQDMFTALRAY